MHAEIFYHFFSSKIVHIFIWRQHQICWWSQIWSSRLAFTTFKGTRGVLGLPAYFEYEDNLKMSMSSNMKTTSNIKTISKRPNQTEQNRPNQTYQIKPTKPTNQKYQNTTTKTYNLKFALSWDSDSSIWLFVTLQS